MSHGLHSRPVDSEVFPGVVREMPDFAANRLWLDSHILIMRAEHNSRPALLLVDDDPDQLALFKIAADRSAQFCRVALADSANRAVDQMFGLIDSLPADLPKIILTDLRMPEVGGLDLIRRFLPSCEVLPITLIAMSNSDHIADAVAALDAGCAAFFQKPGTFDGLKKMMPQLVSISSGQSEERIFMETRQMEFA